MITTALCGTGHRLSLWFTKNIMSSISNYRPNVHSPKGSDKKGTMVLIVPKKLQTKKNIELICFWSIKVAKFIIWHQPMQDIVAYSWKLNAVYSNAVLRLVNIFLYPCNASHYSINFPLPLFALKICRSNCMVRQLVFHEISRLKVIL
jgi:hypothetical protein